MARRSPQLGRTKLKSPNNIEILFNAEVKEESIYDAFQLAVGLDSKSICACVKCWCACVPPTRPPRCSFPCRAFNKERSYLYIRENSLEVNSATGCICCKDECISEDVSVEYFDRPPFRPERICICCGRTQPKLDVVEFGYWCCCQRIVCCEKVVIMPFEQLPPPWCCCPNRTSHLCGCLGMLDCEKLCGGLDGQPKIFSGFEPQPKDPWAFVRAFAEATGYELSGTAKNRIDQHMKGNCSAPVAAVIGAGAVAPMQQAMTGQMMAVQIPLGSVEGRFQAAPAVVIAQAAPAHVVGQPTVVQVSSPAPPETHGMMAVQVPQGMKPGDAIQTQTPNGPVTTQVPAGCLPGQTFNIMQPAPAPLQAVAVQASQLSCASGHALARLPIGAKSGSSGYSKHTCDICSVCSKDTGAKEIFRCAICDYDMCTLCGAKDRTPSASSAAAPPAAASQPIALAVAAAAVEESPVTTGRSRGPTVCSIATPVTTPACSPDSTPTGVKFHRQLQDTRDRLTTLEAEQRRLINTSLGALVKAACAMSSPTGQPSDRLVDFSSLTGRSPAASFELPADTLMVPGGDISTISSVRSPSPGNITASERLEQENQRLRDAIVKTNVKNGELAAMCQAAEDRSRILEEENRLASEELTRKGSLEPATAGESDRCELSASPRPVTPSREGAFAEAARRDLLLASTDVERRLADLFTRRGNLEAMVSAR